MSDDTIQCAACLRKFLRERWCSWSEVPGICNEHPGYCGICVRSLCWNDRKTSESLCCRRGGGEFMWRRRSNTRSVDKLQ